MKIAKQLAIHQQKIQRQVILGLCYFLALAKPLIFLYVIRMRQITQNNAVIIFLSMQKANASRSIKEAYELKGLCHGF